MPVAAPYLADVARTRVYKIEITCDTLTSCTYLMMPSVNIRACTSIASASILHLRRHVTRLQDFSGS